MIDFVTIEKMDAESLALASKVTTHMRECEACMRKVRAFGVIYNELKQLGRKKEARKVLSDMTGQILTDAEPSVESADGIRS